MRIRKEMAKWNLKMFAKLSFILLALFNLFYLSSASIDNALSDINPYNWFILSVFYPVLLAAILANGFRKGTLFIHDYKTIPEFIPKLKAKILQENMALETDGTSQSIYKPTNWFYKQFNAWQGSEKIYIIWGDEIRIEGSLKKMANLEDVLTWNKDFK